MFNKIQYNGSVLEQSLELQSYHKVLILCGGLIYSQFCDYIKQLSVKYIAHLLVICCKYMPNVWYTQFQDSLVS